LEDIVPFKFTTVHAYRKRNGLCIILALIIRSFLWQLLYLNCIQNAEILKEW